MKFSDVPAPYTTLVEGTTPASPAAGQQELFIDSADHKFKRVNSSGTVVTIEGGGAGTNPAVHCTNSANIAIPTATITVLTFDTNRYDQGTGTAQHSTSSNTSRLVCQSTGIYHIVGLATFNGNLGGNRRFIGIRLNGATILAISELPAPTAISNFPSPVVAVSYSLTVADYVELYAYQDSGGSINVNVAVNSSPEFMMHKIS